MMVTVADTTMEARWSWRHDGDGNGGGGAVMKLKAETGMGTGARIKAKARERVRRGWGEDGERVEVMPLVRKTMGAGVGVEARREV